MRTKFILFSILIILMLLLISLQFFQSSYGPHGGAVKPASENYTIEMTNTSGRIYAYLLKQDMKAVSNSGITCDAKLVFPDYSSADIHLKPFGREGFVSELINAYYTSSKITFHVSGKNVSADFANETLFAKNK